MRHGICWTRIKAFSHPCQTFFSSYIFGKVGRLASEEVTLQLAKNNLMYTSLNLWTTGRMFIRCERPKLNLSTSQSYIRFLMKLFNSANIDTINTCRWYFDFRLPSEVLLKKSVKFERKFADCKNLQRYFGISA